METISVKPEDPDQSEVRKLLDDSDRYMSSLYPAESNHAPDLRELKQSGISFFVARLDGRAVGCASLVTKDDQYAEIKRMYVDASIRGHGIGKLLLNSLNEEARRSALKFLKLETGIHQPAAIALYKADGFEECEPFGRYKADPLSVFMKKAL